MPSVKQTNITVNVLLQCFIVLKNTATTSTNIRFSVLLRLIGFITFLITNNIFNQ